MVTLLCQTLQKALW